jgi:hypothetical protein
MFRRGIGLNYVYLAGGQDYDLPQTASEGQGDGPSGMDMPTGFQVRDAS